MSKKNQLTKKTKPMTAARQARKMDRMSKMGQKPASTVVSTAPATTPTPISVETRPCGCCKSDTAIPALFGFVSARCDAEGNLPSRQQVLAAVVCAGCRPAAQYQENLAATRENRPSRQLLSCERVLGSIAEQRRQAQIAKAEAARAFIASTQPVGLMALAALMEAEQVPCQDNKQAVKA